MDQTTSCNARKFICQLQVHPDFLDEQSYSAYLSQIVNDTVDLNLAQQDFVMLCLSGIQAKEDRTVPGRSFAELLIPLATFINTCK